MHCMCLWLVSPTYMAKVNLELTDALDKIKVSSFTLLFTPVSTPVSDMLLLQSSTNMHAVHCLHALLARV